MSHRQVWVEIDGKPVIKKNSHVVWHENTGYWPDYSKGEIIHHKDRNPRNDSFDNLQLMTQSEHIKLHNSEDGDPRHSAEARAKRSRLWKGRQKSPEHMEKLWAGNRGRQRPDHEKERISKTLAGVPKTDEHRENIRRSRIGKKHSEETKAKLKAAWERRKAGK